MAGYLGAAVPVAFAVAGVLADAGRGQPRRTGLAPAAWLALVTGAAVWWMQADPSVGARRIETLMTAEPPWSDAARAHGHDHLGFRAFDRGDYDVAARHFRAAIAVAPNPRYVYQEGLAHLHAGRLAEASRLFETAARLSPRTPDPWLGLAKVSVREGRPALALAQLDSALARDPRSPEALEMRGDLTRR